MYLTVCQQLKHLSKDEFLILRELCRTAKNLTNQAIYQVRQHYFEHSRYLPYEKNYAILKTSENYRLLNSNMAQQILKEVDGSFKSFFGLLKLAKQGKYPFSSCRLPKYLPKDGYATLIVGFVRLNGNRFVLPYSAAYKKHHKPVTITIPPVLADKTIKEIRIIPKADARFFEIQYTYQVEAAQRNLNPTHALAIDFGIDNLMTAVSNRGESFLIDGKRLKSINQWFNKRNACLQSVKDKQHYGKKTTRRQAVLQRKRNNQVRDYMGKAAKQVVTYCIRNDIGTLDRGLQYHIPALLRPWQADEPGLCGNSVRDTPQETEISV
ncbi:MAG: RNA-guided endonuclease InsQ/TnpB family protein [Roseburia sp.]